MPKNMPVLAYPFFFINILNNIGALFMLSFWVGFFCARL